MVSGSSTYHGGPSENPVFLTTELSLQLPGSFVYYFNIKFIISAWVQAYIQGGICKDRGQLYGADSFFLLLCEFPGANKRSHLCLAIGFTC